MGPAVQSGADTPLLLLNPALGRRRRRARGRWRGACGRRRRRARGRWRGGGGLRPKIRVVGQRGDERIGRQRSVGGLPPNRRHGRRYVTVLGDGLGVALAGAAGVGVTRRAATIRAGRHGAAAAAPVACRAGSPQKPKISAGLCVGARGAQPLDATRFPIGVVGQRAEGACEENQAGRQVCAAGARRWSGREERGGLTCVRPSAGAVLPTYAGDPGVARPARACALVYCVQYCVQQGVHESDEGIRGYIHVHATLACSPRST